VFAVVFVWGMSLAGLCAEPETDGKIKERIDRIDPDKKAETGSLEELKRLLMAQAEEIKALRQQLDEQSGRLKQLEQKEGGSARASTHSAHLVKETAMPAASVAPVAAPAAGAQASADAPPSPLSVRIGTADFTPGGFLDFTSIFRSTNVGSGI